MYCPQILSSSICKRFLALLLMMMLVSCAGILPQKKIVVELGQDAVITGGEYKKKKKSKGDRIEVADAPLLLESKGYVGMLLLPVGSPTSLNSRVTLHRVERSPTDNVVCDPSTKKENEMFSKLLSGVNDVQMRLALHRPTEALTRVDELMENYPKIVPLKFLKASCLVAMGQQTQARALLEKGLKELPNDELALQMLATLSGSSGPPQRAPSGKKDTPGGDSND
jgi:Tetratricopeptide repeat